MAYRRTQAAVASNYATPSYVLSGALFTQVGNGHPGSQRGNSSSTAQGHPARISSVMLLVGARFRRGLDPVTFLTRGHDCHCRQFKSVPRFSSTSISAWCISLQLQEFREKFKFPATAVDECDTTHFKTSNQYVNRAVRSKSQTKADAQRIKRVPEKPPHQHLFTNCRAIGNTVTAPCRSRQGCCDYAEMLTRR